MGNCSMGSAISSTEILQECLRLLDGGRGWAKGAEARDIDGRSVDPLADDACAYCIQGTVIRCCDGDFTIVRRVLNELRAVMYELSPNASTLIAFNDDPLRKYIEIERLLNMTKLKVNFAATMGDSVMKEAC